MSAVASGKTPSMFRVALAFAAIYLVWGSTYLAIRFGIETIPPFVMAGSRFLLAGAALYAWCRIRGAERPTLTHWRSAAIVGGLLLLVGNGCVTWAEKTVPSGAAALVVTTVPIWMVLLNWWRPKGVRPGLAEVGGLVLGFGGVAILVGSEKLAGGAPIDRTGAAILILGSLSWSAGSLYSRGAPLPSSKWLAISMEMLCGGALLWALATYNGDWSTLEWAKISRHSLLAVLYLSIFGSLIGFGAYIWLLGVTTPSRVATYAFVNPIVAVLVGYALGGEALTGRVLIASAVIVTGVVLTTLYGRRGPNKASEIVPASSRQAAQLSASGRDETWRHESGACGYCLDPLGVAHARLNRPYFEFLRRDSLSMGLYCIPAGGVDRQGPHAEDEVYFVLAGRAGFQVEGEAHEVAPGAVLYVPAGVTHRLERIVEDLRLLVFFSPAESSRAPGKSNDAAAHQRESCVC